MLETQHMCRQRGCEAILMNSLAQRRLGKKTSLWSAYLRHSNHGAPSGSEEAGYWNRDRMNKLVSNFWSGGPKLVFAAGNAAAAEGCAPAWQPLNAGGFTPILWILIVFLQQLEIILSSSQGFWPETRWSNINPRSMARKFTEWRTQLRNVAFL